MQKKGNRNGCESQIHPGNTSRKKRSGKDVKNKAAVDKSRRGQGKEQQNVHNGIKSNLKPKINRKRKDVEEKKHKLSVNKRIID